MLNKWSIRKWLLLWHRTLFYPQSGNLSTSRSVWFNSSYGREIKKRGIPVDWILIQKFQVL